MFVNYRVYITAFAILLKDFLDRHGFAEFTGEQVSTAINVVLPLLVILFRYFAGKKIPFKQLFTKKQGGLP